MVTFYQVTILIFITCIHDIQSFIASNVRGPSKALTTTICDNVRQLNIQRQSRIHAFSADESDEDADEDAEDLTDEELAATVGNWDDKIARYNTIQLTGRVGNTPEARYFDDGKVVVNLSLACRRKYHGLERKVENIKMGEEETDWYGLEIWGQTAEFVAKYVDKGARVGVVGQLQVDSWNDKATGEARNRAKVIVRDFDILETRAEADLRRSGSRGSSFSMEDDDDLYTSAGSGGFFNTR